MRRNKGRVDYTGEDIKMQNNDNYRLILICAFRYALGRATYMPSTVADAIIAEWPDMPEGDKILYRREIREAIDRGHAGMDCDIKTWERILAL